jgi:hypothetical protein
VVGFLHSVKENKEMNLSAGEVSKRERAKFYSGDGILDINIGVSLVLAGLLVETDMVYLIGGLILVVMLLQQGLKRMITEPRLDAVGFEVSQAMVRRKRVMIIVALSLLAGIGLLLFVAYNLMRGNIYWPVVGGLVAFVVLAIFSLAGWVMQARRYFFYLAAVVAILAITFTQGYPMLYALLACALVFLTGGLYMLLRFISEYQIN